MKNTDLNFVHKVLTSFSGAPAGPCCCPHTRSRPGQRSQGSTNLLPSPLPSYFSYFYLDICHLASRRRRKLVPGRLPWRLLYTRSIRVAIPLHAECIHGLPASQPLKLCLHQVWLETGQVQGRQMLQVVPVDIYVVPKHEYYNLLSKYLYLQFLQ